MNYLIEKYNDISNIKFLKLDERKKNTQLCINYIKNILDIKNIMYYRGKYYQLFMHFVLKLVRLINIL